MTLLVEALTGIAESIMFYMLYEAFFDRKESVSNWFCLTCNTCFGFNVFAFLS